VNQKQKGLPSNLAANSNKYHCSSMILPLPQGKWQSSSEAYLHSLKTILGSYLDQFFQ
jgi:hypothetical protein